MNLKIETAEEIAKKSEVSAWDYSNSVFYLRSSAVIGAWPDFSRLGYSVAKARFKTIVQLFNYRPVFST